MTDSYQLVGPTGQLWNNRSEGYQPVSNLPPLKYQSDQEGIILSQDGDLYDRSHSVIMKGVKQAFYNYQREFYTILLDTGDLILFNGELSYTVASDVTLIMRWNWTEQYIILTKSGEWLLINTYCFDFNKLKDKLNPPEQGPIKRLINYIVSPIVDYLMSHIVDLPSISIDKIINPDNIQLDDIVKKEDELLARDGVILTTKGSYTLRHNNINSTDPKLTRINSHEGLNLVDVIYDSSGLDSNVLGLDDQGNLYNRDHKYNEWYKNDSRLLEKLNLESKWCRLLKLNDKTYLVNQNGDVYRYLYDHLYLTDIDQHIFRW